MNPHRPTAGNGVHRTARLLIAIVIALTLAVLLACTAAPSDPTPDIQATVAAGIAAGIAATKESDKSIEATITDRVEATKDAEPTSTTEPKPTPTLAPTAKSPQTPTPRSPTDPVSDGILISGDGDSVPTVQPDPTANEQSENENEDRDISMGTASKSWYSTCLARTWRAISLDTSVGTAVLLMAACAYQPTLLDQMSCTDVGRQLTEPDQYLPGLEIEGFESLELSDRTDASINCNGLADTSEGPKQLTIRLYRPSVRDQYTIIVNNPDGSGGLVYRGSLRARPRWGDQTTVPTPVAQATGATRTPPGTYP